MIFLPLFDLIKKGILGSETSEVLVIKICRSVLRYMRIRPKKLNGE